MKCLQNPKPDGCRRTPRAGLTTKTLSTSVLALSALAITPAQAEGPGRGDTAQFERDYLTFIIDHHYSALRMTELAAGTDAQRDPAVENPQEGTSPTPGTAATAPKAGMEDIKSMARMGNRMQREEIAKAQMFLRNWYGASHTPALSPEAQQMIQQLEQAPAGAQFEQTFLQLFSNHHYQAVNRSVECQVKSDNDHHQLKEYCEGIVHSQVMGINDMREMLCKQFSICFFQPGSSAGTTTAASTTLRR